MVDSSATSGKRRNKGVNEKRVMLKQNLGGGSDCPKEYKPTDQISEWIRVGTMVFLGTLASWMTCEKHLVFSFRRLRWR